jgi:hypothetical protein
MSFNLAESWKKMSKNRMKMYLLLFLVHFVQLIKGLDLEQDYTNVFNNNKSTFQNSDQKFREPTTLASHLQNSSSHDKSNLNSSDFEFTNYIAVNYIWPILPIFFLVFGTISNILSIIVFTRKEMKKFSSFCYFAFLNAINLAVLYITLIRVIMEFNFKTDIRVLSIPVCKIHVFLTYMLGHLSSLLLCVISVDRVISVMFLHRSKQFCTPKMAYNVTIGLIVFNFLLSSHILIFESAHELHTYENVNNRTRVYFLEKFESNSTYNFINSQIICDSVPGTLYYSMLQSLWKIIDASIFAFIPFFIMLICSVIIIARVATQSNKFKKNKSKSAATSIKSTNTTSTISKHRNSSPNINNTANGNTNNQANKSNEAKFSSRTRNLALMLIPVNILFLMFLSPVVLTMYLYEHLSEDRLTLAIVELLSYCNFTFNFIIYFLTSSKFREEFYKFVNETYAFLTKSNKQLINMGGLTSNMNHKSTLNGEKRARIAANNNRNEAIALLDKNNENNQQEK